MLEDPGTGIQVRPTLLGTRCKYLTRQIAAIPSTCTCTPNPYLHQSLVTYWCSLRTGANDDTSGAGRPLRVARIRCFAVIRTPLNPTLQLTMISTLPRRALYHPFTAPSAGCSPPFLRGWPSQPWDFGGLMWILYPRSDRTSLPFLRLCDF